VLLLVPAGLFARSLHSAARMDVGFRPDHLLMASYDLAQQWYGEERERRFHADLTARVGGVPGVRSVGFAQFYPFTNYSYAGGRVFLEDRPVADDAEAPSMLTVIVGGDYFGAMGTPILRGRGFSENDDSLSRRVAVVTREMVRRNWPGEDPIGKRLSISGQGGPYHEVIGVAGDTRWMFLAEEPRPAVYLPLKQVHAVAGTLLVRTDLEPTSLAAAVREEFRALDPELAVYDVMDMESHLWNGNALLPFRLGAGLAGGLGGLAMLLASVGLFGVVSYTASQRTQEIGLRLALGAVPGRILRMVIGQGVLLTLWGLLAGLCGALFLSRFLSNFLLGVSATDPVTYAAITLLLAAVALLACFIPARRATRVDPMAALRCQ
jgi:putative ABC transport system permease protein